MSTPEVTLIVPAYNEEAAIDEVLDDLTSQFLPPRYEIIVVDDGSQDRTAELARRHPVRLIRHNRNRGYGAALKSGIKAARGATVAFIDADCQHRAQYLHEILAEMQDGDHDMVIGVRRGMVQSTLWRAPGKWLIRTLAQTLTKEKVPDINSGLRAMKRDRALPFLPLCPDGFSITTTLTLCFICEKYRIGYVPIVTNARKGRSTVSLSDGFKTMFNVAALVVLFFPLRVFFPLALTTFLAGISFGLFGIVAFGRMPNTGVILLIGSLFVMCFAILAEQIALLRRVLVRFEADRVSHAWEDQETGCAIDADERETEPLASSFPSVDEPQPAGAIWQPDDVER